MNRMIAIANQKGGVGKSTTAINLSSCLAELGKNVLVVDIDPQGNTTSGFGIDKNQLTNTLYELLLGHIAIQDCILSNVVDHLSLVPSNMNLSGAEIELVSVEGREYLLKNALDQVSESFDFIIMDCPPSMSMLTINAMTAAHSVLIPIQCEYYALEGLSQLLQTVTLVQERLNPDLIVDGVVFTMYDSRNNLSREVVENVRENLDQTIYQTLIPRNVRLAEAPSYGLPINLYDTKSSGAQAYRHLAEEVIKRGSM